MTAAKLPMFDLKGRTLGLFGLLDHDLCVAAAEAILRLNNTSSRKPVHLYLGCSGGSPGDVFMVVDCLSTLRGELHTHAMSRVSGLGVLILVMDNKRFALPHASLSVSSLFESEQVLGFSGGQSRENKKIRIHLENHLGSCAVRELLSRQHDIPAQEAVQIGLVDRIIEPAAPRRKVPEKGMSLTR